MSIGSNAKMLRVNLTKGSIEIETIPEAFYRLYPGGKALAGYILLNELPATYGSAFTGECAGGGKRSADRCASLDGHALCGLGAFAADQCVWRIRGRAGFWGPELKMAGFEAIVIKGASPEPVYLWIKDGQAELRPAGHLWGRTTQEVQEGIRTELDDNKIRVLQIGIAGENLVRYAGADQ